MAIEAWLAVQ